MAIYPNSLISERDVLAIFEKKGMVKNLPIGMRDWSVEEAAEAEA
jgi:hypothetical protein